MKGLRHPATALAALALFVALGGSSLAAVGYIKGTHIKPHSIPKNRLTRGAIKALHGATGPRGAQGPQGVQGTQGLQGLQGAPGSSNYTVVTNTHSADVNEIGVAAIFSLVFFTMLVWLLWIAVASVSLFLASRPAGAARREPSAAMP